jgi:hypothetical protein
MAKLNRTAGRPIVKKKARGRPKEHPETIPVSVPALEKIRINIGIARTVALTVSVALDHQNADDDSDIATTLRVCVINELDRQLERIDAILKGGAS